MELAYADLTPYRPRRHGILALDAEAYYVGWLGTTWECPRGEVDPDILTKLAALRPFVVRQSGGRYCEFCPSTRSIAYWGGFHHIVGERGEVYVAPALIGHYIKAHGYRPPDVFLEAVRRAPIPETLGPPEPLAGEPGVG